MVTFNSQRVLIRNKQEGKGFLQKLGVTSDNDTD